MEFLSKDLKDKPERHTFDRRAFHRYRGYILIWPAGIVLPLIALIFVFALGWGRLLIVLLAAGLFFMRHYTLKRSDVFTAPGCVLYRKRKLFSSLFGSVYYVIYCITNVESVVKGFAYHSAIVRGEIKAVYVLKDGKTIHSSKKSKRVEIPSCFTDMDVIRKTLEDMVPQGVTKSSGGFVSF